MIPSVYRNSRKKESGSFLSNCFWLISPEPFELQKIYLPLLASVLEELSAGKENFQIEEFIFHLRAL